MFRRRKPPPMPLQQWEVVISMDGRPDAPVRHVVDDFYVERGFLPLHRYAFGETSPRGGPVVINEEAIAVSRIHGWQAHRVDVQP